MDRILPFFDPLPPALLHHERGQKDTFFDPLFPHLVDVVIEWPHIPIAMIFVSECQTLKILTCLKIQNYARLSNKAGTHGKLLPDKKQDARQDFTRLPQRS